MPIHPDTRELTATHATPIDNYDPVGLDAARSFRVCVWIPSTMLAFTVDTTDWAPDEAAGIDGLRADVRDAVRRAVEDALPRALGRIHGLDTREVIGLPLKPSVRYVISAVEVQ